MRNTDRRTAGTVTADKIALLAGEVAAPAPEYDGRSTISDIRSDRWRPDGLEFLDIALTFVARGWHVFPCWPRSKKPMTPHGWKDASNDEKDLLAWWNKTPDANVAIATGPSGLTVLDCDHGLATYEDFIRWHESFSRDCTYTVRTGRRDSYGVQLYYYGEQVPSIAWEDSPLAVSGDIRSETGYVMAAGCVHPNTGERYEVIADAPVAICAPYVYSLKSSVKEKAADDGSPIEHHRNVALTSIAGKLRNAGLSRDALEVALLQVNADRCIPPLEEEEVKEIAKHAADWKLPELEPVVTIGGGKRAEVLDAEDAEDMEAMPRPKYPDEVWDGTPYGEFADLCTEGNFIPKKFFSESLRTVVGAVVGDRLTCPITGVNPRSYTIIIGPPQCGKGTSNDRIWDLFDERWEGLERTEGGLIFRPSEFAWRSRGIGAQVSSIASAPGLMKVIEVRKLKQGETPNPIETWNPMPRVLTMSEEVRALFANFANESTGAGLESVLCELYDRDSFTATATKDRAPVSGKLLYSLLGGITKEGWDAVFSKVESVESGFLSRVNIVATEESRRAAGLIKPDFEPLRRRFFPLLQDLQANPRELRPAPSAMGLMNDWFSAFTMPEGISRARLNIHAWRTALHLAWLRGHISILESDIDGGIKIAEHQAKMREYYAPPEGETRSARCEAAIRKVVSGRRRVRLRELRRATNYKQFGIGLWDKSLKELVGAKEMRIEDGEKGQQNGYLAETKGLSHVS